MQFLRLLWTAITSLIGYKRSMSRLQSMGGHRTAMERVLAAYRQGQYESALEAAEGLRDSQDNSSYCYFRGTMLLQLGRFAEADKWLRRNVGLVKDNRLTALAYVTLAESLMHQERWGDSLECLEASLAHWPKRGSTHRAIAEVWLRRNSQLGEAMRYAQLAVEEDQATEGLSPETHDVNLGEDLATLAWAVAATSKNAAEVDRLVEEAVRLVGTAAATATAQVRHHAGRAYAALGDPARSEAHFEEAHRADPHGMWGRITQTPAASFNK